MEPHAKYDYRCGQPMASITMMREARLCISTFLGLYGFYAGRVARQSAVDPEFLGRVMMPDRAASRSPSYGMVTQHMAADRADCSALKATLGKGRGGGSSQGAGDGDCN
jgi:hypothetical protein